MNRINAMPDTIEILRNEHFLFVFNVFLEMFLHENFQIAWQLFSGVLLENLEESGDGTVR